MNRLAFQLLVILRSLEVEHKFKVFSQMVQHTSSYCSHEVQISTKKVEKNNSQNIWSVEGPVIERSGDEIAYVLCTGLYGGIPSCGEEISNCGKAPTIITGNCCPSNDSVAVLASLSPLRGCWRNW